MELQVDYLLAKFDNWVRPQHRLDPYREFISQALVKGHGLRKLVKFLLTQGVKVDRKDLARYIKRHGLRQENACVQLVSVETVEIESMVVPEPELQVIAPIRRGPDFSKYGRPCKPVQSEEDIQLDKNLQLIDTVGWAAIVDDPKEKKKNVTPTGNS